MAEQSRKQSITTELDTSRANLAGYVAALRHDLDVGARLKTSIARNQFAWFAGAAVVGLLISQLPPSRRKVRVKPAAPRNAQAATAGKAAFALTALKFCLEFAKPAIVSWVKKMQERSGSRPAAGR